MMGMYPFVEERQQYKPSRLCLQQKWKQTVICLQKCDTK